MKLVLRLLDNPPAGRSSALTVRLDSLFELDGEGLRVDTVHRRRSADVLPFAADVNDAVAESHLGVHHAVIWGCRQQGGRETEGLLEPLDGASLIFVRDA
jgi:hypothetical protein